MLKLIAKVILKKEVWSIMKKQMHMIVDTNLKLIKDGNISAFYIQKTTMSLSGEQEPYQFVLLNINNE